MISVFLKLFNISLEDFVKEIKFESMDASYIHSSALLASAKTIKKTRLLCGIQYNTNIAFRHTTYDILWMNKLCWELDSCFTFLLKGKPLSYGLNFIKNNSHLFLAVQNRSIGDLVTH